MQNVTWITKNGKHIPITNEYMNNYIRNKGKMTDKDEFKGHFQDKKQEYGYVDDKWKEIKNDAYYQLDNGEKIEFIDKKEYKKMIDDFYSSLNDDEKTALEIWVDNPSFIGSNPMLKYNKDYEAIMDNLFKTKAVELKKDTLLFRRASDDYLDLEVGVNHKHAMSTSAYDTIPKTMPSGLPFGDKELYIIAPKGTKVLPIEKVAVNHPANTQTDKTIYTRQHEIILPKNTNYEIVQDLSTYYIRPPKMNETSGVPTTEQKYVVKLTDKEYPKREYEKPYYHYGAGEYGTYLYKHKGKNIEIREKNTQKLYNWNEKKPRQEVVKYYVPALGWTDQEEYYSTYAEAINAIKKYL